MVLIPKALRVSFSRVDEINYFLRGTVDAIRGGLGGRRRLSVNRAAFQGKLHDVGAAAASRRVDRSPRPLASAPRYFVSPCFARYHSRECPLSNSYTALAPSASLQHAYWVRPGHFTVLLTFTFRITISLLKLAPICFVVTYTKFLSYLPKVR